MPTMLPGRRRFWRRYRPDPETVRNGLATTSEFILALAFVTATVVILTQVDFSRVRFPAPPTTSLPVYGP